MVKYNIIKSLCLLPDDWQGLTSHIQPKASKISIRTVIQKYDISLSLINKCGPVDLKNYLTILMLLL